MQCYRRPYSKWLLYGHESGLSARRFITKVCRQNFHRAGITCFQVHGDQAAKVECLPGSLGFKSLSRVWEGAGDLVKLKGEASTGW